MNPTEYEEQVSFVHWLDMVDLKHTAIPNHTYNPHRSQQAKNRRLGLHKGFPDLVVLIPTDKSKDGEGYFIAIEMKRIKGSQTSPEQTAWIEAINDLGSHNVVAYACKGADAAINVVNHYIRPVTNDSVF